MPNLDQETPNNQFIVINPAERRSGLMTNLGMAGMVGGGLAGLGGLGVNQGSNAAQSYLQKHDPYDPTALDRVNQFNRAMGSKGSPPKKLLDYVQHGSALMSEPAMRSGATGRDLMQKIYSNPLTKAMGGKITGKPDEFVWNGQKSQHYGEFAKGPTRGYFQLARELSTHKTDNPRLLDQTELLQPLKNDYAKILAEADKRRQLRLSQRLSALDASGATLDPAELELRRQRITDQLKLVDPRANAAYVNGKFDLNQALKAYESEVNQRVGKYSRKYGDPANNYHGAGLGYQAEQLAKSQGLNKLGPKGVAGLPVEKQMELLRTMTNNSAAGKEMAKEFAKQWAGPMDQYKTLGNVMAAPKKMLDSTVKGLGSVSRGAKSVAKGGLTAAGLGFLLNRLGAMADSNGEAERTKVIAEQLAKAMGASPRGSTGDTTPMYAKTPAKPSFNYIPNPAYRYTTQPGMPLLGGVGTKTAGAYLLPPKLDFLKKKKKVQPVQKEDEEEKLAAFAKQAIDQVQLEFQARLQAGDLGGGWHPDKQIKN